MPCGHALSSGGVVRRIDVEERVDRLSRPIRDANTITSGPFIDLANAFNSQRATQVFAQGHGPKRNHRVTLSSRFTTSKIGCRFDARLVQALNEIPLHGGEAEQMRQLLDALEDLDDTQHVYTSALLDA